MSQMTRAAFNQFYGPAVNRYLEQVRANFIKDRASTAPVWEKLFYKRTTNKEHVHISQQTGFGTYRPMVEGAAVELDQNAQSFPKTFSWEEYGLGFAVTDKMIRFEKFDQMSKMMTSMMIAERNSIELLKARPWNNAFSSSFPTPDGKALCASDHLIVKTGGTQSNLFTSTDLSPASAEVILTAWRNTLTDDGFPANLGKPQLVIPPSMEWLAEKVFMGNMNYTTANNEQNVLKGRISRVVIHDWLTVGAYFLQVSETNSEMNPMVHWWVDQPYGWTVKDPHTFTVTKARKFFGGEGTTHYIGIMGVQQ